MVIIMKANLCVLLCLLTLALYFSSSRASIEVPASSTSAGVATPRVSGRRLLNPPSSSASRTALGDAKTQDDGRVGRPQIKEGSEREVEENSEEGLIYNVDYHGVITHPSPLPRHPKP